MSTERASKKRKIRSGSSSGIELPSAVLVLQKFRETITTIELDDNDEGPRLEVDIDLRIEQDALSQLDSVLQWMDTKIKSTAKAHKFSSVQSDILTDLQISSGPLLHLKPD